MTKQQFSTVLVVVLLVGAIFGGLLVSSLPEVAEAAPAAAITPVSFSGQGGDNLKVTFFNGNVTADTRVCHDLSNFNKIDLQYVIDQTTTNTTTLNLQWSNNHNPASNTGHYEASATIVSGNTSDANGGNQFLTAGQWNCVLADVSNSNPVAITVLGVAK